MNEIPQETIFKLNMLEQQVQQIQEQLKAVERGIAEMDNLISGLDNLQGAKGKEIFAPIGRGIFARARLDSEELNVDIGGGNFVKKNIPETKKIIEEQIQKLEEVQKELEEGLKKISEEFNTLILEAQENVHEHPENCGCGEGCECKKEEKKEGTKNKRIEELV